MESKIVVTKGWVMRSCLTGTLFGEEKLKSLSMRVKKESEKAVLKLNTHKIKITVSGPITSWQRDGGKGGNNDRFYFLRLQNHCEW